jgi:murein DD-endopeptidase MepM/ murein hydrolase activator NlpD
MAKQLGARKAIARIDSNEYLEPNSKEIFIDMGIDYLFYPEQIAAREVINLLGHTSTTEYVDFAAGKNKHVVAPANGIVAYTYDKCTSGGLGNGCGIPWGGGNQVLLIVQVGNRTYGILNCHMSKGLDVKTGDIVEQGTILGNVGSTGNSSGAHLHQEIYDLGTMSLQQALNRYKSYGVTFGTGWNTLTTTCDRRGTPCRMNPQNIYNVKVGYSYN